MSGYLVVVSGDRTLGLPADGVDEILQVTDVLPAPVVRAAVRGVLPVRNGLVPLVHLAAALDDTAPPATASGLAVLVRGAGRLVALEVDATDAFVREEPGPVPPAWEMSWAVGVARHDGRLVPVVDLDVLVERLRADRAGVPT